MLKEYGNLWELADEGCNALVITTNGFVRKDGQAVMGRGIAKEAADRFPELPKELGTLLRNHGNQCYPLWGYTAYTIVTFPVKPVWGPNGVPGWRANAELPIIKQSAEELVALADKYEWTDILLPRPGAGYGHLKWEDVEPMLSNILDNRFTVVTFHP